MGTMSVSIDIESFSPHKAIFMEDTETGRTTIMLDSKDGPIMSGDSREEAKVKFAHALSLHTALKKLIAFRDVVNSIFGPPKHVLP